MRKLLLIPVLALFTCVSAWAGVARIGNTQYETLNAAFAAATNGSQIYLLDDVTVSSAISVGNDVTLFMQGHTITNSVAGGFLFSVAANFSITGNADGQGANAQMIIPAGNTTSNGFIDLAAASISLSVYNVDFSGVPATKTGFFNANNQHVNILLQDCNANIPSGSCKGIIYHGDSNTNGSHYRILRGNYTFLTTLTSPTPQAFRSPLYAGSVELQNVELHMHHGHVAQAGYGTHNTYSDCKFYWEAATSWKETAATSAGYTDIDYPGTGAYIYREDLGTGYFGDNSYAGVSVINSGEYMGAYYAIETMSSGGVVIVNGGKFSGTNKAIAVQGGTQYMDNNTPEYCAASKALIIVNGGEFSGNIMVSNENKAQSVVVGATSTLEINGGVFTNLNSISVGVSACTFTITGGTFSGTAVTAESLATYVPSGYTITPNSDGSFTVTKPQSTNNTNVSWTDAGDWSDNTVPSASSEVSVAASTTVTVGDGSSNVEAEAQSIDLAAGSTLVVKDNATLVVGEGGLTGSGSVTVEDGGQLLISPHTDAPVHPQGTVTFKAEHARTSGDFMGGHCWEHIAVPTIGYPTITADPSGLTTYINKWDLTSGWAELDNFPTQFNENFVGYSITNSSTTGNVTYTFTGTLVGNADQTMDFSAEGFTYFANSYTGAINIPALLSKFETGSDVQRAVYLWNPEQEHYMAITTRNAGTTVGLATYPSEIKPMQAFFIFSHDAASQDVSYESSVWGPMLANRAAAPARNGRVNNDMVISLISENGRYDNLVLGLSASAEDNEILKFKNPATSVNVYAITENGIMSFLANDALNTVYLGITTNGSSTYTMQFSGMANGEYELYDAVANCCVTIMESATYTFTENSNSTVENRFSVRKINNAPTSIYNVDANGTHVWQSGQILTITDNNAMNDINIYSLNGALVLSQPASSTAIETISLESLNAGAYLVKVGNVSKKIIK